MMNPDFNLAELLKTIRDLDLLDEPVLRVDDPSPTEHVPLRARPRGSGLVDPPAGVR